MALSFHTPFIKLIMNCVIIVRYAIQVNGIVGEYFQPSMGIRQGDPISPYLFLLCMEGLETMFHDVDMRGLIHEI